MLLSMSGSQQPFRSLTARRRAIRRAINVFYLDLPKEILLRCLSAPKNWTRDVVMPASIKGLDHWAIATSKNQAAVRQGGAAGAIIARRR
jgi:hypothetical protein